MNATTDSPRAEKRLVLLMKIALVLTVLLAGVLSSPDAWAGPDDYAGDTVIYGGESSYVKPNVLLILDTSGSMDDEVPGSKYDPAINYSTVKECGQNLDQNCQKNTVYVRKRFSGFFVNYDYWEPLVPLGSVTNSCGGSTPKDALVVVGRWASSERQLNAGGNCEAGSGTFVTGNWINWYYGSASLSPKIDVAKIVLEDVINSTDGVDFGLMAFDQDQSCERVLFWTVCRRAAEGGEFVIGSNGYTTTIKDMKPSTGNKAKLILAMKELTASGGTPLAETLYEAMRYFKGEPKYFENSPFTTATSTPYTSPITASCQKNVIILISDGMSTVDDNSVLTTFCGNAGYCDPDANDPAGDPEKTYSSDGTDYLDDIAYYLQNHDMASSIAGDQKVTVHTIGFGFDQAAIDAGAIKLLEETAENGGGKFAKADNLTDLYDALNNFFGELLQKDTSFVAPVVPKSPQNRTYSGQRLYFGLFKPMADTDWRGNIKKYGIAGNGDIVDKNGAAALLSSGAINPDATSFWSATKDGEKVDEGGVGRLLQERDPDTRKIYANIDDAKPDLTHNKNAFTIGNPHLTAGELGVSTATDRDKIISYVRGKDVYDDSKDGSKTDNRPWTLGDVLHSGPQVVTYDALNVSTTETTCPADNQWNTPSTSYNRSVVFAGANDGMLHAFRDCDGQELWGFIPDDLLPDLKKLHDTPHNYFVDAPPVVFYFDKDDDGNIEPAGGDKVALIFGTRRGEGMDRLLPSGSRGSYYALDVTNPASPQLLWKVNNTLGGFEEMGETWSQPTLVKMKVNQSGVPTPLVVAWIGAGYDNNEDRRYGKTQNFPALTDSSDTSAPTSDSGDETSSGSAGQHNPKGRGVYALKVAHFDGSGNAVLATSPTKIWGYTYATGGSRTVDNNPVFSIPSDVSALDFDYDGYVDRLYVGDTGGNMWRADVGQKNPAAWTFERIFAANDVSGSDKGRKIFYRPSVTLERDRTATVYFGTGDRAHPLNRAMTERIYAVKDPAQLDGIALSEDDLVDMTKNLLQEDSISAADLAALGAANTAEGVDKILEALKNGDGWFIKLDQNPGEKVLAAPLVFDKVAYVTTFTPEALVTDPCQPGNLGTGRLYALNYLTGEAVQNYDPANDSESTSNNSRGATAGGHVLRRSDRVRTVGSGIPTSVKIIMREKDPNDPTVKEKAEIILGSGAGIIREEATPGGLIIPLYWLQR